MPKGKPTPRPESDSVRSVGMIIVMNGKQKGQQFNIKEGNNSVGSDPSCAIAITADELVSSKHASIKYVDSGKERIFVITDLDSSNGTFLNDSDDRIGREELVDNDTVLIGTTKLKFKAT